MRYHLCVSAPRGANLTECKALPRFTGRTRHSLLANCFRCAAPNRIRSAPLPLFQQTRSLCAEDQQTTSVLHRVTCGLYSIHYFLSSHGFLKLFRSGKLFLGAGQGGGGNMISAVEPGKLMLSALGIQRAHLGVGSASPLFLGDDEMAVGHGGDLRQVGHAHDLLAS